MKRIAVLIIAMIYLAVSSGFTMHLHYCMGHFVQATLINDSADEHDCAHCGMKKKAGGNGCCEDQHKIIKNDTDHAPAKEVTISVPYTSLAVLPHPFFFPITAAATIDRVVPSFNAHAPPDPDLIPIYLQIRNLRI